MSNSHTIFFSCNIWGRKPVIVIKRDGGRLRVETYKNSFDMPDDLRHQYFCQRVTHHMSRSRFGDKYK